METWLAALEMYAARPAIVNQAIVRLSLSDDPFPDLGKLISKCEEIRCEIDGIQKVGTKIGTKSVQAVAAAWGLEV